jgi:hypothetical protein
VFATECLAWLQSPLTSFLARWIWPPRIVRCPRDSDSRVTNAMSLGEHDAADRFLDSYSKTDLVKDPVRAHQTNDRVPGQCYAGARVAPGKRAAAHCQCNFHRVTGRSTILQRKKLTPWWYPEAIHQNCIQCVSSQDLGDILA